jgi:DNA-binding winged helix-turn-helix (wHTH) protein
MSSRGSRDFPTFFPETMRKQFRDCVFDSDTRELVRGGRPVHLSPKAYGLLDLLLRRAPNAVSKDEIQTSVWGDVFVSESALTNAVAEIRAALGDQARSPELLRTVHGFGYAFSGNLIGEESVVVSGDHQFRLVRGKRSFPLFEGENVLGRDPDARVSIDHASVSRHHARILIEDGKAVLADLRSRNGTFVGGRPVNDPTPLKDGAVIGLGPVTLVFEILGTAGTTASDLHS